MILRGYIFTYLLIFSLIFISFLIHKRFDNEYPRKIVHIGVAFYFLVAYKYFGSTIHIMVPPLSFIIINYIDYRKEILKFIEKDRGPGTVYYAISVFILALITYIYPEFYPYFGAGLFVMAFADGLASIVSKFIKSKKIYKDKTMTGTVTVFVISIIVILLFNKGFNLDLEWWKIIILGFISSILELFGEKGLDNIILPIGVALIGYWLGVI